MLSKKFRLSKQDIERVYKRGKTFRDSFLVIRFLPNNSGHYRFATVIPKKVALKATQRNRLKRKTFAFLEEILKEVKIGNFDIILSFKTIPEEQSIKPVLSKILEKFTSNGVR